MRDTVMIGPVHPSPVRHYARALDEAERLQAFVTGYVYQPARPLERMCSVADKLFQNRLGGFLRRRALADVNPQRCRRAPVIEALYQLGRRLPLVRRLEPFQHHWKQHALVDRFAAHGVLNESTRLVLAREDGALASFRRARQLGARTLYDLPTAHYQTVSQILEREEAEFPGICHVAGTARHFSPARQAHKDAELEAADHVIAPSLFVERSLIRAGFPAEDISVLPFACEASWLTDTRSGNGDLHRQGNLILHVANLSLRKGTHRLLRVWKRLGAYRTHRLRLIGEMCLTSSFLKDFQGCYEHIPRLPQEELRPHYAAATAFVLPAAAEGFAVVILEALSYGLPILASQNSGAEGFLEHQKQALLHEFGNEDQLAGHLDWVLSHPRERAEMACHAREKARSWNWQDFRRNFLDIVRRLDEKACAASTRPASGRMFAIQT